MRILSIFLTSILLSSCGSFLVDNSLAPPPPTRTGNGLVISGYASQVPTVTSDAPEPVSTYQVLGAELGYQFSDRNYMGLFFQHDENNGFAARSTLSVKGWFRLNGQPKKWNHWMGFGLGTSWYDLYKPNLSDPDKGWLIYQQFRYAARYSITEDFSGYIGTNTGFGFSGVSAYLNSTATLGLQYEFSKHFFATVSGNYGITSAGEDKWYDTPGFQIVGV